MGRVGLGSKKWTHVHLCVNSSESICFTQLAADFSADRQGKHMRCIHEPPSYHHHAYRAGNGDISISSWFWQTELMKLRDGHWKLPNFASIPLFEFAGQQS